MSNNQTKNWHTATPAAKAKAIALGLAIIIVRISIIVGFVVLIGLLQFFGTQYA